MHRGLRSRNMSGSSVAEPQWRLAAGSGILLNGDERGDGNGEATKHGRRRRRRTRGHRAMRLHDPHGRVRFWKPPRPRPHRRQQRQLKTKLLHHVFGGANVATKVPHHADAVNILSTCLRRMAQRAEAAEQKLERADKKIHMLKEKLTALRPKPAKLPLSITHKAYIKSSYSSPTAKHHAKLQRRAERRATAAIPIPAAPSTPTTPTTPRLSVEPVAPVFSKNYRFVNSQDRLNWLDSQGLLSPMQRLSRKYLTDFFLGMDNIRYLIETYGHAFAMRYASYTFGFWSWRSNQCDDEEWTRWHRERFKYSCSTVAAIAGLPYSELSPIEVSNWTRTLDIKQQCRNSMFPFVKPELKLAKEGKRRAFKQLQINYDSSGFKFKRRMQFIYILIRECTLPALLLLVIYYALFLA